MRLGVKALIQIKMGMKVKMGGKSGLVFLMDAKRHRSRGFYASKISKYCRVVARIRVALDPLRSRHGCPRGFCGRMCSWYGLPPRLFATPARCRD